MKAILGPGYVAVLTNKTKGTLIVHVKFQRGSRFWPFTETLKEGDLTLKSNQTKEFGWREKLELRKGDRILISHPDYEELTSEIPQTID
jgi:hypothetical protein